MKRATPSSKDPTAALKELLERPELPGLVLITSPDQVRLQRIEERIINKSSVPRNQISKIRGDELSTETLTRLKDDLATLSLFSGPRLYTIYHLDSAPSAATKTLAQMLVDPLPGTTVLGLATELTASDPLVQAASKLGGYLKFPELSGNELSQWAAREIAQAGIAKCPSALVERLIETAEKRPDAIAAMAAQFALYLDDAPATIEAFDALFPSTAVAGEFELIDAIAAGSTVRAEVLFETLLRSGKSPFMLLGMISKIFNNYHSIALMLAQRMTPQVIRESLKMTPWVFNKSLEVAKRIKTQEIEGQLRAILRADSKLKNKSLGPQAIFSELFNALRPVTTSNA